MPECGADARKEEQDGQEGIAWGHTYETHKYSRKGRREDNHIAHHRSLGNDADYWIEKGRDSLDHCQQSGHSVTDSKFFNDQGQCGSKEGRVAIMHEVDR